MSKTYERYLESNIDLSLIGLTQEADDIDYFCTPKGAKIIGRAGSDGIHFCFIPGFGEMVFVVNPMSTPGSYVHPLARNFQDFLRLLLACGNTAALAQAWCWDEEQFNEFLLENPPTDEQAATLAAIRENLSLDPMEQPFSYIRALQNRFDYRLIPYREGYYDMVSVEPPIPEWKVYFDGNFWMHHRRERAGKEIPINKQFVWEDEVWMIPAMYVCAKGLVIDFCLQVPPERIRAFMDKWNLSIDDDRTGLTEEQRMLADAENPLIVSINPKVILNGAELATSHGCGLCWNPCFPEGNGLEAYSVVQHYGLDPEQGYAIWRSAFPWKTKRKPGLKTLSVILTREPVPIPGPHFRVSSPGDRIELVHPSTGEKHTLTVQEYKRQELPAEHFHDLNQELPRHYIMMSYTISPDIPGRSFMITDCGQSDQPRPKQTDPRAPQAKGDVCCVGIIGGRDGPTAVVLEGGNQGKLRVAFSALHFEPVKQVEWRTVFYEKKHKDITIELLCDQD